MTSLNAQPQRPFIVPVFIPHAGCPHRCVFCNQKAITGHGELQPLEAFEAHIEQFLAYRRANRRQAQISFYGGNFLGLPMDVCRQLLNLATRFVREGKVDTIRFSTRPDTITADRLEMLEDFPVATVELGVQSMDDQVLQRSQRGHTAADTEVAATRLKAAGLEIGMQMMIGLPGDNPEKALVSCQRVAALKPDFIRIYPTLVLSDSRLAAWYAAGRYNPLALEEAIDLTARLYLLFNQYKVPVVRMGLQASSELDLAGHVLAGPYHPAFGHLVYARIFREKIVSHLKPIDKFSSKILTISAHPRNIPRVRGLHNQNLVYLQAHFNLKSVQVIPDATLALDEVEIAI